MRYRWSLWGARGVCCATVLVARASCGGALWSRIALWFVPVLALVSAAAASRPVPPKEMHIPSLNVGPYARMTAVRADDVLGSRGPDTGARGSDFSFRCGSTVHVYHGAMLYVNARAVVDGEESTPPLQPEQPRNQVDARLPNRKRKREGNFQGWQQPGTGRRRGSTLRIRSCVRDVVVVKLCQLAVQSLESNYDAVGHGAIALGGLAKLRLEYESISAKALKKAAWTTAESGSVGLLLSLGTCRSKHDPLQQDVVAVSITRGAGGKIVCACSGPEACHGPAGCTFDKDVHFALSEIRSAMAVTMEEVFAVLSSTLRPAGLERGTAVLYSKNLSLVRAGGGSWPFAVVRKGAAGKWVCVSCVTAKLDCGHRAAADQAITAKEAREEVDEGFDPALPLEEEDKECDGDDGRPAQEPLVNRFKWASRSFGTRHFVPPDHAQRNQQALLVQAAAGGAPKVYKAPPACRFCGTCRGVARVKSHHCRIEFQDGAVDALVEAWRCPGCRFKVIPDGKEEGVIFHSSCTGFSESFLFELAVSTTRNGTALQSAAHLREGYLQLNGHHKYLPRALRLRSVSVLRHAMMLYVELVLKGLPLSVSMCSRCQSADGSLSVVCFDGLQLGYQVKHKKPFVRVSARTRPIPRASSFAHLVRDGALAKALGTVLCLSSAGPTINAKTVSTLAAMRGYVMAVSAVLGGVEVDGVTRTYSSSAPDKGGTRQRGWCPAVDGGAHPAFLSFLRRVFDCDDAARSLALAVASGTADFRRRVPRPLMARINKLVVGGGAEDADADVSGSMSPPEDVPLKDFPHFAAGARDGSICGVGPEDAAPTAGQTVPVLVGPEPRSPSGPPNTAADSVLLDAELSSLDSYVSEGSSSPGSSAVSEDGIRDADRDGIKPRATKVNVLAPLAAYAEQLGEPALADTGGVKGMLYESRLHMRVQKNIPTTVAATHKIIQFARALAVDPVMVWSDGKDWSGVNFLEDVMRRVDFDQDLLQDALHQPAVSEFRLLRGAVACLGPVLVDDPDLRLMLADLLAALKDTEAAYKTFVDCDVDGGDDGAPVSDEDQSNDGDDGKQEYTAEEMAQCHPSQSFSTQQFTNAWVRPPASPERFREAYGLGAPTFEDVIKEGVWAPSLPALRPVPSFVGTGSEVVHEPACSHLMGREKGFTAGTFGAFCTCRHPKCVGVVVLHGSESQRMPIEFIVQRFPILPRRVVYDFSCASLKSALCRLPEVALSVSFLVDRFHWYKNHVLCSQAMNPDSYESMWGINTSASEERNALARRQECILRKMTQDNFIKMMVYQQVISNVVAMFKDEKKEDTTCMWMLWYRRKYVDNAPDVLSVAREQRADTAGRGNLTEGRGGSMAGGRMADDVGA